MVWGLLISETCAVKLCSTSREREDQFTTQSSAIKINDPLYNTCQNEILQCTSISSLQLFLTIAALCSTHKKMVCIVCMQVFHITASDVSLALQGYKFLGSQQYSHTAKKNHFQLPSRNCRFQIYHNVVLSSAFLRRHCILLISV